MPGMAIKSCPRLVAHECLTTARLRRCAIDSQYYNADDGNEHQSSHVSHAASSWAAHTDPQPPNMATVTPAAADLVVVRIILGMRSHASSGI